jgi:hypothetical protein
MQLLFSSLLFSSLLFSSLLFSSLLFSSLLFSSKRLSVLPVDNYYMLTCFIMSVAFVLTAVTPV